MSRIQSHLAIVFYIDLFGRQVTRSSKNLAKELRCTEAHMMEQMALTVEAGYLEISSPNRGKITIVVTEKGRKVADLVYDDLFHKNTRKS